MENQFFERPVINSPYTYPERHWELDEDGQPTQQIKDSRRRAEFITPIPKPRKRRDTGQQTLVFDEGKGLSTEAQQYDPTSIINNLRKHVDRCRIIPNSNDWHVTPETARLLHHWRHHRFSGIRPFFCQVEAIETAIWLTEVAPNAGKAGKDFLEHLTAANEQANPELMRLALKLATGTGKTTVMAMIIAWQTINAVRRPNSRRFTRGFLVVTPGITIRDRLRVLQPNDPDSYYESRELIPKDMIADLDRAKIIITNFHAFKLKERIELSKGGRSLLQGRGEELNTLETEGRMLQRVMPDLMGIKNILVLNDEAHHCYREKAGGAEEEELKGDDRKEAEKNTEAARLWISGLEIVKRKLVGENPVKAVLDPYNPTGSTIHVNFNTSRTERWETDSRHCHINWIIYDRDWEAEFCRVAESHPKVKAYVKNHNLGLEVPYRFGSSMRTYIPDFIVVVDMGEGRLLNLIVEIKGYRREDAKEKKATMDTYWIPGVNNLKQYGTWAFAEFTEVYQIEADFTTKVEMEFNKMIESIGVGR